MRLKIVDRKKPIDKALFPQYRFFLLMWGHYSLVRPFCFLIPVDKLTPRKCRILRAAHSNFIDTRRNHIPESTHEVRQWLSRWLQKYEVTLESLQKPPLPLVVEVCYTGQIG